METQGSPRIARSTLNTKNYAGRLSLRDLNTHCKATLIKTEGYGHQDKWIKGKESPEINSHIYGRWISRGWQDNSTGKKNGVFNKWHGQNNEGGPLSHTIYKLICNGSKV